MAATFFPLVIGWFLLAPRLHCLKMKLSITCASFASRASCALCCTASGSSAWIDINAPIIPIFAIVLGAASALGMVMWRTLYFLLNRKGQEAEKIFVGFTGDVAVHYSQ